MVRQKTIKKNQKQLLIDVKKYGVKAPKKGKDYVHINVVKVDPTKMVAKKSDKPIRDIPLGMRIPKRKASSKVF